MPTKVRPLEDKVLVRPLEPTNETPGGILIPETVQERPRRGIVMAVGPGVVMDDGRLNETTLKVGDQVLFPLYAGSELELDGKDVRIMRETEVLAVIES